MTNLPDDVLLFSIKPDGEWLGGGLGPDEALGAAAVAQSVIDGHVTIDGTGITVKDDLPLPGDTVRRLRDDGTLAGAVSILGPLAKSRGLDELERRGVIGIERKRFLGFIPTTRMTMLDPAPRDAVVARIEAMLTAPADSDVGAEGRTGSLLIAILDAAGRVRDGPAATGLSSTR